MATWGATGGSEVGLAGFIEWSGRSSKFDRAVTADRWAHYAKSPLTASARARCFWEADRAVPGWTKPSCAQPEVPTAPG